MIYFSGVDSIIECAYLRDIPGDNIKESGIFINPTNITYLAGKTVVVTSPSYPLSAISTLLQHRNTVVSRVALGVEEEGIIYNPYITRPEWGMMWNGEVIEEEIIELQQILDHCSFSPSSMTCYFPKISNTTLPLMDSRGNLTELGYALHQIGQNVDPELAFQDLDVLKTKKMQI